MKKSTILHLRFPFSLFLLPVFLFATAVNDAQLDLNFWLCFFILHFLVYPASNGYNSYFDKDEESIGGLKNPPKVSKELYVAALVLDGLGLLLALVISFQFMLMILVYGLVSKAYSHPMIRLKKLPILGWLAAGIFQGYFTFLLTTMAILKINFQALFIPEIQFPAILSSMLLFGSYPMTQVYQHKEDGERGDETISRRLGILGTFYFTGVFFTLATAGFWVYFLNFQDLEIGILFQTLLIPVLIFFTSWFLQVRKNKAKADYENTMRLNAISSISFILIFLSWWVFF